MFEDIATFFLQNLYRDFSDQFGLGRDQAFLARSIAKSTTGDEWLDNRENQVFTLPSGREIGFAEYGKPNSPPVIYLHGFDGSRLEGKAWENHAEKEGVRLICPDRPGFGLSTYQAGRRIVDYPNDVQELARHLGIREYSILGMSAGGPYGLTCAKYLPSTQVSRIALVAPMGPVNLSRLYMNDAYNGAWAVANLGLLSRCFVWWEFVRPARSNDPLDALQKVFAKPQHQPKEPEGQRETEVRKLEHFTAIRMNAIREHFRPGALGSIVESKIHTEPFGFDLQEIYFPNLRIWHAREDKTVPVGVSKTMAQQIPNVKFTEIATGGHLSIVYDHGSEILRWCIGNDDCKEASPKTATG